MSLSNESYFSSACHNLQGQGMHMICDVKAILQTIIYFLLSLWTLSYCKSHGILFLFLTDICNPSSLKYAFTENPAEGPKLSFHPLVATIPVH